MTFDMFDIVYAVVGLALGLAIGFFVFGNRTRLQELDELVDERDAELRAKREEVDGLERELAMARDQIAPLADEVDRLKAVSSRKSEKKEASLPGAAAPVPTEKRVKAFESTEKIPAFLPERPDNPDDLSLMKGVGPRLLKTLHEMGIYYFAQIADWTDQERKTVDAKMGNFRGRIERDQLQEQAKLLAAGRVTEYEARFGKLGTPSE